jgi:hypothetical protein
MPPSVVAATEQSVAMTRQFQVATNTLIPRMRTLTSPPLDSGQVGLHGIG